MTIMGIVIPSQIEKKELDKNAKKIKRKKGQYAQQRLFFKPRTNLDGRKRYKWGTNKDVYPSNVANPLTCKVPSFVDFVETKETRFFFYMLEDWDFNRNASPVEEELSCRALLHWRLRIFTGSVNEEEKKIIKFYLKTASKIIDDSMPRKNFWPYKDGLVHVYGQKKDMTYKNRNKFADHIDFNKEQPFVFFNYFNETKNKLSKFEREISRETSLNKKEAYWTKTFQVIYKKSDLPDKIFFKTRFNYQNIDLVTASYLSWKHNNIVPHKKEPKKGLVSDWKLIYSLYKELDALHKKSPSLFLDNEIMVTTI